MKRITRRQARSWLSPMRACFRQMLEGEVDAINGYLVTRLHHDDDYARIDFCIAGFRALMDRLWPELDCTPLIKLEKRFAAGVLIERDDLIAAFRLLNDVEKRLMKRTVREVKAAVLAEQIVIELEQAGIKAAA